MKNLSSEDLEDEDVAKAPCQGAQSVKPFNHRLKEMLVLVLPCIFGSFFILLQELVNLAFVG